MSAVKFGSCARIETKKLYSNGMYSLDLIFEDKAISSISGTKSNIDKVRDMVRAAHWAGYVGVDLVTTGDEGTEKQKSVCLVQPVKTEGLG